ncbi:hypothetical protein C8R45DRAFT_940612 [Mycena sanguinolenta]|nr:hypothetical protein C8R45DRAFT_940612 [Mycena sanguinolenta]
MPHNGPSCIPKFFNGAISIAEHDASAGCFFFAVVAGKVPGIYLNAKDAEAQTRGFRGQNMKKFPTRNEALDYWTYHCLQGHKSHAARFKVKGIEGRFNSYNDALAAAAAEYITEL